MVKTNNWIRVKNDFDPYYDYLHLHQYKATTEHEDTNTWLPTVFILSNLFYNVWL